MKNVFIVLLVAAIGVGIYYYFSQKQKASFASRKSLILGKWELDSTVDTRIGKAPRDGLFLSIDSALRNYQIEVKKGTFISQSPDGKMKDTGYYEFANDVTVFTWSNSDTSRTAWNIERVDTAILVLKDKDSTSFYFQRIK